MSSPLACVRCSRLAPPVTPGGLCEECAVTADTAADTSRSAGLPSDPPTASFFRPPDGSTAPSPPARPLPTAPAGYELLDRLGGGGMGEVYLAREAVSERLVAMKFLKSPGDPAAFGRFAEELRVLAKLDHPDIVGVFASDFLRADPYFTMEYVPGGSLARAAGPLPVAAAVELMRAVAGAIGAAHAAGVIHRDLKPSNILIGDDGMPKVVDFGLAKRLDATDPLTIASGALGTPGYMPPEQVSRKNGDVGAWSDVYGLGATLYHLLVGKAPFVGDSVADTIAKVLADPPPRVRASRPDVPLGLEAIVLKCLEKDPKDRYPSMAELVADLDRYETGLKTDAPLLTRRRRAGRWARRHRRRLFTGAVALAAVAGAFTLGAAYWPLRPQPPVPVPPDPVAVARRELAEGRPVTLIGQTGLPKYHRFLLEPNTLGESSGADKTCAFRTDEFALLELFPPPGVPRYRIDFDLRHWPVPADRTRPEDPDTDFVGVYFGHASAPAGNGLTHAALLVTFRDSDHNSALRGEPAAPQPVVLRRNGFVQYPDRTVGNSWAQVGGGLKFRPVTKRPGRWRTISVEVTPDRVVVLWRDDAGTMVPLAELTADKARDHYDKVRAALDKAAPGAAGALPPWSPDLGFGVISYKAAVAVRNVIVTPLPNR